MTTLVTPSAKSHERVTGRWVRDLQAESKRDWVVYYTKLTIGTPIPWIFTAFLCSVFISRAAVEITAWATAVLALIYIIADRFGRDHEFEFFRIGSEFTLFGFIAVSLAGIASATTPTEAFNGLGSIRWVLLFYLLTWCWQLFPGLNRMYQMLFAFAGATAMYGVVQHFMGFDFLRQASLEYAPLKEHAFHTITGFYRNPEILGTVFAALLPFPAAAFMLADKREKASVHVLSLSLVLLLLVGVLWTYRPGLWIAAAAGLLISMVLQPKRQLLLLLILSTFLIGLVQLTYGQSQSFADQMTQAEIARGERQRAQINEQLRLWSENTWIGTGLRADSARHAESSDGNVYFQLLAQTGALGLAFYLLFQLNFLLGVYRVWREIPRTHFWHRVLTSGGIAGLAAFHVSGLYWSTLSDSHATNLFVFLLASLGYLGSHYDNGIVPDDQSL